MEVDDERARGAFLAHEGDRRSEIGRHERLRMADEKDIKPGDEHEPADGAPETPAEPAASASSEAEPEPEASAAADDASASDAEDADAAPEPAKEPTAAEAMAAQALRAAREAIASLGDEDESAPVESGAPAEGQSIGSAPVGPEHASSAQPVDLPDLMAEQIAELAEQGEGIDLLSDVNLQVKIELGRTRMYVEDVLRLRNGAVVELDKLAGDPVDVYVNDRPVARGEVLILNDNFCVRINEILSSNPKET